MTLSMALIWYFASIHLIFLLSIPKNVAHLQFNASVQEKTRCMKKERVALLSCKQKLVDEFDILSPWETDVNCDCCNWRGVECTNTTTTHHHIIRLDLHGSYNNERHLMGEVGSSLTQLSHLNYLDLSSNLFDRIVCEDIASLIDLIYLNLSHNNFATLVPPHLAWEPFKIVCS
ncbi:unnamed protein product [Citrullus colocynthis]|uniref:Leucine-rich repeat-containing N-terminal plant-type domain-containing protein n=1 Tax=Citrullus colocynthis TaxID=252529 RepID=A0ABP0YCG3_9ROSI